MASNAGSMRTTLASRGGAVARCGAAGGFCWATIASAKTRTSPDPNIVCLVIGASLFCRKDCDTIPAERAHPEFLANLYGHRAGSKLRCVRLRENFRRLQCLRIDLQNVGGLRLARSALTGDI